MSEAQAIIDYAAECGQRACSEMNAIDQATLPRPVWDVLYDQGEAIGALTAAVLMLMEERKDG